MIKLRNKKIHIIRRSKNPDLEGKPLSKSSIEAFALLGEVLVGIKNTMKKGKSSSENMSQLNPNELHEHIDQRHQKRKV